MVGLSSLKRRVAMLDRTSQSPIEKMFGSFDEFHQFFMDGVHDPKLASDDLLDIYFDLKRIHETPSIWAW